MKITIAPGDGIGPESMDVVLDVFEAAEVPLEIDQVTLGAAAERAGAVDGVSAAARASIARTGVLLRGPVATSAGRERFDLGLRREYGAFAEKRVYRMLPGVPTPLGVRELDLTLIRELSAHAWPADERLVEDSVVQCSRFATRASALRIHRYAFEIAARKGRRRVTCAHLADEMKVAGGMFLDAFREVAAQHPQIAADDLPVDRLALRLLAEPEAFEVLVLPDMPGDIVSYLAAGLVGGLDYAPTATIGEQVAVFAPLHDAAPGLAGRDLANPTALLLSATMMLRHVGLVDAAVTIERALERSLFQMHRRPDLLRYVTSFRTSVFRHLMLTELRKERRGRPVAPRFGVLRGGSAVPGDADAATSSSAFAQQLDGLA